jgi:hypothetical protein
MFIIIVNVNYLRSSDGGWGEPNANRGVTPDRVRPLGGWGEPNANRGVDIAMKFIYLIMLDTVN